MVEKVYELYQGNQKLIKRMIVDENINYNHIVLNKGECLPEHYANATVYMTILRGQIAIRVDDQETHYYGKGRILKIPNGTKMNVGCEAEETLEFTIVKAPAPKE